ncbi:MAG: hypothetical protein PUD73_06660 [bacterium]|nr:hypothetical protein [bacterium]
MANEQRRLDMGGEIWHLLESHLWGQRVASGRGAKALAEQGFLCKGDWPRHRRKLPLRNSRTSGSSHLFDRK